MIAELLIVASLTNSLSLLEPIERIIVPDYEAYTVSFDLTGGSGNVPSQLVLETGTVSEPTQTPTKIGCSFLCWTDRYGVEWDFENRAIYGNTTIYASWTWVDYTVGPGSDCFQYHDDDHIDDYLQYKYPLSYGWQLTESKDISEVSGYELINIPTQNVFPESDIVAGLNQSTSWSSYGGCGPIALIGILHYFSNYTQYSYLLPNHSSSSDRINLATQVFNGSTFNTFVLPDGSTFQSGGQFAGTLSLTMGAFGHYGEITGNYLNGSFINPSSNVSNFSYLAEQEICAGKPVTFYNAYQTTGQLPFVNHYVNIFGYKKYSGTSVDGSNLTTTLFKTRINWSGYGDARYLDSHSFCLNNCCLIIYNLS